jgi:hypothetical protein
LWYANNHHTFHQFKQSHLCQQFHHFIQQTLPMGTTKRFITTTVLARRVAQLIRRTKGTVLTVGLYARFVQNTTVKEGN